MSGSVRVLGLEKVLSNLNKALTESKKTTKKGLIRAGFFIQRGSQQRCPVDTSNLKNSAYTAWGEGSASNPDFRTSGVSGKTVSPAEVAQMSANHEAEITKRKAAVQGKLAVYVGYSAAYALFVHEDLAANHPNGGEAKFLESAIQDNQAQIIRIATETEKENIAK